MSIDLLQDKIRAMKNPTMVGIDPSEELIPPHILREAYEAYGETPEGLAAAYKRFCFELLDALKDIVPAVKLQSGCFEMLGAPGVAVMQETAKQAKALGYYVTLDSLRSDAPHIAKHYADMVFGGVKVGNSTFEPYGCDAVTVNGYLGSDSVAPYTEYCREKGKNLFLMVRSSNRSGREVQDLLTGDRSVHTAMADLIMRWNGGQYGRYGFSEIGAVVGAYDSKNLSMLRLKYDRLFFLVVGYGAQGGTAKPVSAAFDFLGHGAIVAASRSIIGAWKEKETDGTDYCAQAAAAAMKMKKDIGGYVSIM